MDIREARYVLEIANTQHLTKAANNLYVTQPALSKVLKKLEQEFGVAIFLKDGNALVPTEIGQIVLKRAAVILEEFQKMNDEINELREKDHNRLRITLPEMGGFYTSKIITDFMLEYPDIHLIISEAGGNETQRLFKEQKIDVGFLIRPFTMEGYNAHPVYSSEIVVGIDEMHPWSDKDYICPEDFNDQFFASMGEEYQFHTQIMNLFNEHGVNAMPKLLSKDYVTLLNYCRNTDIPCILPKPCLDYYGWKGMETKRFKPAFPWELCIVYPQVNTPTSKLTRLFVNYVLENFEAANDW